MLSGSRFEESLRAKVLSQTPHSDSQRLVKIPPEAASGVNLPDDALAFLIEAGLPRSCAPFIGFEELGSGLRRIWEVYSTGQWKDKPTEILAPFIVIGSEGSGSPVCLTEPDGRVVILDHELFSLPKRCLREAVFLNTSVPQLAECLIAAACSPLKERLETTRSIDALAAENGAFWHDDIASELEMEAGYESRNPWWKFW